MDDIATMTLEQTRAAAQELLDSTTGDLAGADAERFQALTQRDEHLREQQQQRAVASRELVRRLAAGELRTEAGSTQQIGGADDDSDRQRSKPLQGQQVLTREQSLVQWTRDNGLSTTDEPVSFDKYLRGIVTSDWRGAPEERALSEGTLTAGGHLVPTPIASSVIDLARNQTRVLQAGAVVVPMTANTLKMPRLTVENSPAWRNENASITAQDLTFDVVTFTARSLARLIILSRELFQDSDPSAGDVIARSFAAQIAVELDRVGLRGTGTAPEPRGVLNTSGITTTTHGANGTGLTNYDFLLDAAGAVRAANWEPTGHIVAPRTLTNLGKLKETSTLAYLAPPSALLPILPTSQVPINLTVGTSTDCSEIYTGQWNMLAIGVRQGFEIEFLRERYADTGQYAFVAHLRADVQVLQPTAFVVDTGVRA